VYGHTSTISKFDSRPEYNCNGSTPALGTRGFESLLLHTLGLNPVFAPPLLVLSPQVFWKIIKTSTYATKSLSLVKGSPLRGIKQVRFGFSTNM
jgi:hypothetical protein